MPELPPLERRDTDPSAYTWPAWATNIQQAGFKWSMEINGNLLNTPIYGRVSMNSLPELHRFALAIDVAAPNTRWEIPMADTCARLRCDAQVGARRVVLINADGSEGGPCGAYCDPCTDRLLDRLIPSYHDGRPAYRVEREDPGRA